MFDSENEFGIYQTSHFFAKLDAAVSTLLAEERSRIVREVEGMKTKNTDGKTYHSGHPDVIRDQTLDDIKALINNSEIVNI